VRHLLEVCRASAASRGVGRRADGLSVVLAGAVLVSKDARDEFLSRCQMARAEASARGLTLEVSGPWPPYHFCPSCAEA
jgi:hypothetical protein